MTFKTGKIYKIIHNQSNVVYIGSTFNKRLRECWQQNKKDFKKYLEGKRGCCSIYPYFEEYGIENFKMILIKEYQVLDRQHLKVYETLWIKKLKSVNKWQPISLNSLRKKEYDKIRYQANKEKIAKRGKEKIKCECGSEVSRNHFKRHLKSKKHQNYIIHKLD